MSDMTSFLSKGWFRDCLKARFVACRAGQMTLGASRYRTEAGIALAAR